MVLLLENCAFANRILFHEVGKPLAARAEDLLCAQLHFVRLIEALRDRFKSCQSFSVWSA